MLWICRPAPHFDRELMVTSLILEHKTTSVFKTMGSPLAGPCDLSHGGAAL
jgi:hypothetical protein